VLSNVAVKSSGTPPFELTSLSNGNESGKLAILIQAECDVLAVRDCVLHSGRGTNRDRCVYWTPQTGRTSVVSVSNCVFEGSGYGLWLHQPPKRCDIKNVLFTSNRAAVRCDVGVAKSASVSLNASQVTQVGGISFLDAVVTDATANDLSVRLTCGESVLSVSTGIIQVAAPPEWPLANVRVECLLPERGNPTIIPPDVSTAIAFDATLNAVVQLREEQVRSEALLIANPVFRGQGNADDSGEQAAQYDDFELLDYEGPKLSPALPGVDVRQLPKP